MIVTSFPHSQRQFQKVLPLSRWESSMTVSRPNFIPVNSSFGGMGVAYLAGEDAGVMGTSLMPTRGKRKENPADESEVVDFGRTAELGRKGFISFLSRSNRFFLSKKSKATPDEYRAIGTPLRQRVEEVASRHGVWFDLGQGGYEINLDGWHTAEMLRDLADAMDPPKLTAGAGSC